MEPKRLFNGELRLLSIIWANEPVASGELVRLCQQELGWKKSTVYTMVKKLADKGLVANESATVRSLVPREEVLRQETRNFVDQTFSGSLPGFLVSFYGGKGIDPEEASELEKLIQKMKRG